MICPQCREQYDIYNAYLNKEAAIWECPICYIPLEDEDWLKKMERKF